MDLQTYRKICTHCIQPEFSCYCRHIQTFDPGIQFVILIHPIEVRRRVATGRMSHLILKNSLLVSGQDFSQNQQVNDLTEDPQNQCVVLYPGGAAINLSTLELPDRRSLIEPNKNLVLFVVDGTWATAKKTLRQSENLRLLPRLCFDPEQPSRFRVRKQPRPGYLSTIEAIHQTLELLSPPADRAHDKLLYAFDKMVERQLEFVERSRNNPEYCRYHRAKQKLLAGKTL
jgi:DTW domain-containing protein